jgi:hypothetical protein
VASLVSSMEFGQVVLLRSDGSEGQALTIRKDVTFGRDHPAHIRIKSKSIALQHAKILVSPEGACYLQILEASSRPRINGVRMSDRRREASRLLQHMDVITIAGRSFLFKSKNGLDMDLYNSRIETDTVAMSVAVAERERTQRDDELDSMSLDSRSSRRSTGSSQMSTTSAYSVSSALSSGVAENASMDCSVAEKQKAFAHLYLQKKDGTEGAPYAVVNEVIFGR